MNRGDNVMSLDRILGRQDECRRLDACMRRKTAQLVVVYGRRRVGKTFLINEYFNDSFSFKITGAYKQNLSFQLENFAKEIRRKSGESWNTPKSWSEAFEYLRDYLESLDTIKKQIVFFDEMPWLDTPRAGFLPAFEWFWNDWGSSRNNLFFIVCGSATSWMSKHLLDNKGGLFNRQTCRLYLKPFTLREAEQYLDSIDIHWSRMDIAECYMIMGGIPYYLSLLSSEESFSQNIDRLFFRDKGELWDEFVHLYRTLFTGSDNCIKIVEALSTRSSGLTRGEIIEKTGLPSNGAMTSMLEDLIASGFVRVSNFYDRKKKDALYQLADYYTAFYYRYIKDNYGKDAHFWSNSIDNPSRRAWSELVFEQLCKDHIAQIKQKLGISGVLSQESIWYTRGDEELGIPGAQIDLLIERRDRVINLCEMKFSINEYVINKTYDESLRNKVDSFRRMTRSRASLQLTMITTYGVRPNKYSSRVQNQVTLDDLFAF